MQKNLDTPLTKNKQPIKICENNEFLLFYIQISISEFKTAEKLQHPIFNRKKINAPFSKKSMPPPPHPPDLPGKKITTFLC